MNGRWTKRATFVGRVSYLIAALLALASMIQVRLTGVNADLIIQICVAIWFLAVGGAIGLWLG